MTFLLDTNTVSEMTKPRPDPGLASWSADIDETSLFLSVVTLAELRFGVDRLPAGRKRSGLERWLSVELAERFAGRILAVDARIADRWGSVTAACLSIGRPIGGMDAFLAATADCHGFTLVTRNVTHFSMLKIPLVSPWSG